MRVARLSIWTRAKHRVGLERPHFCTPFRGQSDAWVAPAHIEIPSGVLPVCVAGFERRQVKEEDESGEEGKQYSLHFQNCHFFTRPAEYRIRFQLSTTTTAAKVTAQESSNRAGATPLFRGRSARKFCGVAPALGGAPRRRFARLHMRAQEFVRQNV